MAAPPKGLPDSNDTVAASHVRNAVQKRKAAAGAKKKPKNPSLQDVYGMAANDPSAFVGPVTLKQALGAANAAANVKYGGALGTLNQQIAEAPQWYQDYKNSVEGARVAAQHYQQGLVDQSNNIANQVGQTVLGSMQDQQAAESRKALANAGTNLIAGMGAANDTYFGDRKGVADASKIATMTNLLTQKRQVQKEKGDYRTSTLNDIRATATNADIARQTLGNNYAKDQARAAIDVAKIGQTAKDNRLKRRADRRKAQAGRRVQIRGQDITQANIDARLKIAGAKKRAKHKASIQKATGGVENDVQDLVDQWNGYVGRSTKDKATGKVRKLTDDDIRRIVGAKADAGMLHIAEQVRSGAPLDEQSRHYLHSKNPNIRIPKSWLRGRNQAPNVHNAPDGSGGSRPT